MALEPVRFEFGRDVGLLRVQAMSSNAGDSELVAMRLHAGLGC